MNGAGAVRDEMCSRTCLRSRSIEERAQAVPGTINAVDAEVGAPNVGGPMVTAGGHDKLGTKRGDTLMAFALPR